MGGVEPKLTATVDETFRDLFAYFGKQPRPPEKFRESEVRKYLRAIGFLLSRISEARENAPDSADLYTEMLSAILENSENTLLLYAKHWSEIPKGIKQSIRDLGLLDDIPDNCFVPGCADEHRKKFDK